MFFTGLKQVYLRVFLGVVVIAFAAISTVGMFGSTEMQAVHHQQSSSLGSSLANTPDNGQTDHLEDLVAWDNFGPASSPAGLAALFILILVAAFSILPRFKLFTPTSAQPLSRLYTKPSGFCLALQEAFSSGLINGKAY